MLITKLQHCPGKEVVIVQIGKSSKGGKPSEGRPTGLICEGCWEVLAREIWKH